MERKSETIRARVEPKLKKAAEAIFNKLGLSTTDAITLFYKQVEMQEGLPFDVKVLNEETRKALREVRMKQGLKKHKSLEDFKKSLGLQ